MMRNLTSKIALLAVGALCLAQGMASSVFSAPQNAIVSTLAAFKITDNNGTEKVESTDQIKVGETLEYRVTYRNNGAKAVKDLEATLPIPSELQYIPDSARPAAVTASTDGRVFATPPLRRRVKTADGEKVVLVPVSEYRHLRWKVKTLAPGASFSVAARATLRR
jgi:uncharacterized repeat protein (TIGR01451 family)